VAAALVVAASAAASAAPLTPEAVRIFEEALVTLPTRDDALRVLREIPDIEFLKPTDEENVYRFVSTPAIDRLLAEMGYSVTVLVPDLAAQFEASASAGPNFGVFHTYSETEAYLDSIAAAFPAITTDKFSIGSSLEGRTIWAIKVSDNPDTDEDEGEILFDGVTHAREIMTVEMCLHYLNYLCSNYGVDPLATFLVDNREVWFVPIVNPDGFVYNETTNPTGGGLWRKNRNPNGGGCAGVDNNRNYSYQWGGLGASTDPCSETYRGTAPNSEPENQAMEAFIDSRQFTVHQSFHSAAEMVLLPWGYDQTVHTPDDSLLRAIGDEMARDSGYQVGQPGEILYNASGVAFDWSYGETTNHDMI
ncbi:MAG: M14 family metallopeptidase, partial [Actinobacteria bacterium]|nr:M14 family metallopeptidase [Actinomycetota bacterium]